MVSCEILYSVDSTNIELKSVWVVGGFGSSPWLIKQLKGGPRRQRIFILPTRFQSGSVGGRAFILFLLTNN